MYVRHIVFATHLQTSSKFFINIWNGILFVTYVYWQRDICIFIYICNNIYIYISPIPIFSFCDYQLYLVDDWFGDKQNVPRGMSLQANLKLLIEPHWKTDRWSDERNIWRDSCIVSVSEYLQSADFTYVLPDRRRRRPYQRTRISVNRYVEKQKFPCPTCPSVFSHKNNLYYHSKFECGQLPRFNCPYCVYRTKHVSNVRAHVRRKHPGHNVYAIDVCKILGA